MDLTYNLTSQKLVDSDGAPLKNRPKITYQQKPIIKLTLVTGIDPVTKTRTYPDVSGFTSFRAALDKDFNALTTPIARTVEGITMAHETATLTIPLDTDTPSAYAAIGSSASITCYLEVSLKLQNESPELIVVFPVTLAGRVDPDPAGDPVPGNEYVRTVNGQSGDVQLGDLELTDPPSDDAHLANKAYVDASSATATDAMGFTSSATLTAPIYSAVVAFDTPDSVMDGEYLAQSATLWTKTVTFQPPSPVPTDQIDGNTGMIIMREQGPITYGQSINRGPVDFLLTKEGYSYYESNAMMKRIPTTFLPFGDNTNTLPYPKNSTTDAPFVITQGTSYLDVPSTIFTATTSGTITKIAITNPTESTATVTLKKGETVLGTYTVPPNGCARACTIAYATGDVITATGDAAAEVTVTRVEPLSEVARTGAYADLSGKPTLAAVASSGAYADLTGAPIPAARPFSLQKAGSTTVSITSSHFVIGEVGNPFVFTAVSGKTYTQDQFMLPRDLSSGNYYVYAFPAGAEDIASVGYPLIGKTIELTYPGIIWVDTSTVPYSSKISVGGNWSTQDLVLVGRIVVITSTSAIFTPMECNLDMFGGYAYNRASAPVRTIATNQYLAEQACVMIVTITCASDQTSKITLKSLNGNGVVFATFMGVPGETVVYAQPLDAYEGVYVLTEGTGTVTHVFKPKRVDSVAGNMPMPDVQ